MMIAAIMYAGKGNSALARDAMMAVVMIVLNGMVGVSLILGGLRYHEQAYNLQGANAFLAVILPLAVLGLVLPNFTASSPGPTLSPLQAGFLVFMSLALYGVFLGIQTSRHPDYFTAPKLRRADGRREAAPVHEVHSVPFHTVLLIAYVLPLVVLSKQIAVPINHAIHVLHAPAAVGGFLVSVLILSPESLGSVRAALELKAEVERLIERLDRSAARVYVPRRDLDYALDVGLRMLFMRHLVDENGGIYLAREEELPLLRYYANSIAHLLD